MNLIATIGTVAIFAAAPASIGLIGDATFSADVPVRVPSRATLLDSEGNPTHEPSAEIGRRGDDHGGNRPRARHTEPPDDQGGRGLSSEVGDAHGGGSTEAGDDQGSHGSGGDGTDTGDDDGGERRTGSTDAGDEQGGGDQSSRGPTGKE
jgi:hypothetical protein